MSGWLSIEEDGEVKFESADGNVSFIVGRIDLSRYPVDHLGQRVEALTKKTDHLALDPRDYDYRRLRVEASRIDCPNGPDECGNWPCDPRGYFGVAECQVCGRVGVFLNPDASMPPPDVETLG